jgi:hypothetical protein
VVGCREAAIYLGSARGGSVTEIDKAVEHAWTLFREHVERYRTEIHCEPLAWRRRCAELHDELQWLLFCQSHPLSTARRPLPPEAPPPFRR